MNIIKSKTVRSEVTHRIEIDREALLQLLGPHTDCGDIPPTATVFIKVPGGGDWSNMDLAINGLHPIVITWTEVTNDQE